MTKCKVCGNKADCVGGYYPGNKPKDNNGTLDCFCSGHCNHDWCMMVDEFKAKYGSDNGRAKTPTQKEVVMRRLLIAWKSMPDLRLGQLLINAIDNKKDPFYIEDYELVQMVEEFLKKNSG